MKHISNTNKVEGQEIVPRNSGKYKII